MDGYEAAGFGNETDYLEGAAPAEEDNRAHHEIFQENVRKLDGTNIFKWYFSLETIYFPDQNIFDRFFMKN